MSSPTDSASSNAGALRFRRLRRRVLAFGVLVIVAFAGSSIYDIRLSYRHALSTTHREIGNVATALAGQTAWTWQTVDLLLRETARWYRDDAPELAPERVDEVLANRVSSVRQVRLVTLVDAEGFQRHRSRGASPPNLDVSDRTYFTSQRDGSADGVFTSELLITRSENRPGVILSRRLDGIDGAFAGVVTAIVDLEELKDFYQAVSLGRGDAIQLLRDDGSLLIRNPPTSDMVGQKFPTLAAAPRGAATRIVSPIDGTPDFIAVARVRDTPLVIAVTRDAAVALDAWRGEAIRLGARALLIALLGAVTLIALLRQLDRIERGETALREREAQLRQSQKMEAIGTLAGGIAHDFNNILGAILGYGELAQQQSPKGGAVRRYIDHVMHAAGRAKALVDRILGFSRSGLGERVPVNVEDVVAETLELLEASTPAGIRIEARLAAHDAAIIGDATWLHQVAMNLCTNALQAMPHGGLLRVELDAVDLDAPKTISRGVLPPGRYARLAVGDTGTGIPAAVVERMFDPFFTTKRVGEGTGLGLSLVHGIVTDLGGAIDVATVEGRGTTFSIWLPLTNETAAPAESDTAELPRGNGETVLVVDDEKALVELAEEMLAELGYEPIGFDSSVDALAAFRAEPARFDLVLSDEVMPDLVGTELAERIRALGAAVPIVIMSGNGGANLAMRAAAIGVDEVLRKPLRSRDLAEALARVLGAAR